jgi:hypothetical protein
VDSSAENRRWSGKPLAAPKARDAGPNTALVAPSQRRRQRELRDQVAIDDFLPLALSRRRPRTKIFRMGKKSVDNRLADSFPATRERGGDRILPSNRRRMAFHGVP